MGISCTSGCAPALLSCTFNPSFLSFISGSGYVYFVPIILQMLVNLAVMYKFIFGNLPQMQGKAKKVNTGTNFKYHARDYPQLAFILNLIP